MADMQHKGPAEKRGSTTRTRGSGEIGQRWSVEIPSGQRGSITRTRGSGEIGEKRRSGLTRAPPPTQVTRVDDEADMSRHGGKRGSQINADSSERKQSSNRGSLLSQEAGGMLPGMVTVTHSSSRPTSPSSLLGPDRSPEESIVSNVASRGSISSDGLASVADSDAVTQPQKSNTKGRGSLLGLPSAIGAAIGAAGSGQDSQTGRRASGARSMEVSSAGMGYVQQERDEAKANQNRATPPPTAPRPSPHQEQRRHQEKQSQQEVSRSSSKGSYSTRRASAQDPRLLSDTVVEGPGSTSEHFDMRRTSTSLPEQYRSRRSMDNIPLDMEDREASACMGLKLLQVAGNAPPGRRASGLRSAEVVSAGMSSQDNDANFNQARRASYFGDASRADKDESKDRSKAYAPQGSGADMSTLDQATSEYSAIPDAGKPDGNMSLPIWARPVMDYCLDSPSASSSAKVKQAERKSKPAGVESGQRKASRSVFTHKGVWIWPGSVGDAISSTPTQRREMLPAEQHAGYIDDRAGIDVGNAILAFEFIDRINDEVYNHYLPIIDETLSKDLGLEHDDYRLEMPHWAEETAQQRARDDYDDSEATSRNDDSRSMGSCDYGYYGGQVQYEFAHTQQDVDVDLNQFQSATPEYDDEGVDTNEDAPIHEASAPTSNWTPEDQSREYQHEQADDDHVSPLPVQQYQSAGPEADPCYSGESPWLLSDDDLTLEALGVPRATSALQSMVASSPSQSPDITHSNGNQIFDSPSPDGITSGNFNEGADIRSKQSQSLSKKDYSPDPPSLPYSLGPSIPGFHAETQVWPNACTMAPKATSTMRSGKLKAVDSMPDPVSPSFFDNSAQTAARPDSSTSSLLLAGGSMAMGSDRIAGFSPQGSRGGSAMILPSTSLFDRTDLLLQSLPNPNDPCTAMAPPTSCYSAGAARVRGVGCHQYERARLERNRMRAKARARKHAAASLQLKAKREQSLHASIRSAPARIGDQHSSLSPEVSTMSVTSMPCPSQELRSAPGTSGTQGGGTITDSVMDSVEKSFVMSGAPSPPAIGGADAQVASPTSPTSVSTKPCSPKLGEEDPQWLGKQDQLEDLLNMHVQVETAMSRAKRKPKERAFQENENCPFSEEDMDLTATVDLRCGHRFSLARLSTARRGPTMCASAGFALRDALICPLCGDQDITTMPGVGDAEYLSAKKMLTCYSTDTDAYLGELRKDWQRPLSLPMQAGAENDVLPQRGFDSGTMKKSPEKKSPDTFTLPALRK